MFTRCLFIAFAVGGGALASLSHAGGPALPFGGLILDLEPSNNMQVGSQVIPLDGAEAKFGFLILLDGDQDFFRVSMLNGQSLTVTTTPLGGAPGAPFIEPDTQLSILNSAGMTLLESLDAGSDFPGSPARGSVVRFRATADDLYAVRIRGASSPNPIYAVMISKTGGGLQDAIEAEPNDSSIQALVLGLPYCGPVLGLFTLSSGTDVDYFAVELRVGEALTVTTTPLEAPPGFTMPDTILTVFDSDGTTALVESDDDFGADSGGINFGSTVRVRATHTGRHYVRCRSYLSSSSGLYSMTASVAPRLGLLCPSDLDGDGVVNATDLALVLGAWGACP